MCPPIIWHNEIRNEFDFQLVDNEAKGNRDAIRCMQSLKGRYHAKGFNEEVAEERFLEIRIDEELTLISGDVFNDESHLDHRFSFISETVAYSCVDGTFRLVAPLDMFDHKDVPKGAVLLKGVLSAGGAYRLQECHLMALNASGGSFLREDLQVFELKRKAHFLREMKLTVLRGSDVEVPGIFSNGAMNPSVASFARSVEAVFERAGVSLQSSFDPEPVDVNTPLNTGSELTNEELYSLVVKNSQQNDSRSWEARLLFANKIAVEIGRSSRVFGRMFDTIEPARRGAVVFLDPILGAESVKELDEPEKSQEIEYLKLHMTVHEIGHLFNLLHTHQKDYDHKRTRTARPGSVSWMAYRNLFPFGSLATFVGREAWKGHDLFRSLFEDSGNFDNEELRFIRHGPYPEVVMGGKWAADSAEGLDASDAASVEDVERRPDIRLRLIPSNLKPNPSGLPTIQQFEMLEGALTIEVEGGATISLPRGIHPDDGAVSLWIKRPRQRTAMRYRPPFLSCSETEPFLANGPDVLEARLPPLLGKDNWATREPGECEIFAACDLPGGGRLISNVLRFQVVRINASMERAFGAFLGDDKVARFVSLNGSHESTFEDVAEKIAQLERDQTDLTIVNQLKRFRGWAALRTRQVGGNMDERSKAYARAESLLCKADDISKNSLLCGNVDPLMATDVLLDACRTMASHQGPDIANQRAHLVANTKKALQTLGSSKNAEDWLERMIVHTTNAAQEAG